MEIYEPDEPDKIPFRLIDSIGFEPGFWQRNRAINAVKNWSKDCAKIGKEDTAISVIWFCVEGTSSKGNTAQITIKNKMARQRKPAVVEEVLK